MPRPKKNDQLVELAKRGAQARLSDLVHEVKLLLGLFPHLQDNFSKDELPIDFLLKRGARGARAVRDAGAQAGDAASAKVARQTRNLSAAARRAISRAQKKRWAAHRAAKAAAKKA